MLSRPHAFSPSLFVSMSRSHALSISVSTSIHIHIYERRIFITKIHADRVFRACISFSRCFRASCIPTWKMLVYLGMLPCLVSLIIIMIIIICANWYLVLIAFRSRSGVDQSLNYLGRSFPLVLQACISHMEFQTKVARFCLCLVRIKCQLLIYIYVCMYMCCEVVNWSKFGLFNGY